jgi:hypothetical protein
MLIVLSAVRVVGTPPTYAYDAVARYAHQAASAVGGMSATPPARRHQSPSRGVPAFSSVAVPDVAAETGGALAKFDPAFAVSQGEATIKTPYGAAAQSPSAAAAALQSRGRERRNLVPSWRVRHPRDRDGSVLVTEEPLLTPGYAEGFGTPGNAIDERPR